MAKKMQYQTVWTQGKKGSDDAFFVRANVFVIEQGFKVEFDDLDKVCWHLTATSRLEPPASIRIPTVFGSWVASVCWKTTAVKKSAT